MSAVLSSNTAAAKPAQRSEGVWAAAWRRLRADKVGMVCMAIVAFFLVLVTLSGTGLIAGDWQKEVGVPNAPPTFMGPKPAEAVGAIAVPTGPNVDISDIDPLAPKYKEWEERAKQFKTTETVKRETLPFGGDRLGRDVLSKAIKGAEISVFVGVAAAIVATLIGTVLGALAGFFGGRVGDFLEWLYTVFTAIPDILLIFALAAVFGRGIGTVVLILGLTGWTGPYRLMRAEYIKHKAREYVMAADAIGASAWSRMFGHILPNVSHVILVRMGLLVVGFIKAEVILSYLGLGVPIDQVSWGTMLAEAREFILRAWWVVTFPGLAILISVLAINLMGDGLRDALDPKLKRS